jgi:1,4-alpha-glucan branching enzyme
VSQPTHEAAERALLVAGTHHDPHRYLGVHGSTRDGVAGGRVVRAFHPDAVRCEAFLDAGVAPIELEARGFGVFEAELSADAPVSRRTRLRFHFADGNAWERLDPYAFAPTLGALDLHLISEGNHERLWDALGARALTHEGVLGTAFAVWAPNATRVSVVGDFCRWDGRLCPMRSLGGSGVWELFVPLLPPGSLYKFELRTKAGELRLKTDPMARAMESAPGTASRVARSAHVWGDADWCWHRGGRDPLREPMAIYEVHLGSWQRVPEEGHRWLSYREIAPRLADHCRALGFNYVELLPIMEHPFVGSWGYQVAGYYAPTARWGTPDDLRFLVDHLHQRGIGVILDWVPAHFPKDDWGLRRFDGEALYEHADPRRGEHPDWGTLVFDFGRVEVRNFLIANALYWLEEFHVDGLRVDAVASMLYLDYSREKTGWLPNAYGGRENLEALEFLRRLNALVARKHPGCFTIAEESTDWPGVTRPAHEGGLGFTFKWNMGWMHDSLRFFARDPSHRRWHHDELTFAMLYEYDESFVNPLSHDEVVHEKRSLFGKFPGDEWQKLATLRLLLTYQWTRPGKILDFMGTELAPPSEWNHDRSLDWHLSAEPPRAGLMRFMAALGRAYHAEPSLWRWDHDPVGFRWIDCADREQSVVSYLRVDGDAHALVVLNMTPMPRDGYRIGAPTPARYRVLLSSDAPEFGGSGAPVETHHTPDAVPCHGFAHSLRLRLPPLAALVLVPES